MTDVPQWLQLGALGVLCVVLRWVGSLVRDELKAQRSDAAAQRKELRDTFLSAVESQTVVIREGLDTVAEAVRAHDERESARISELTEALASRRNGRETLT